MPNIKLMESGLPVAPLKIGALESCRELGEKVNDYIVQFRKSTMDKNTDSPLYYNYLRDNYLIDCPCPRFGSGEAKGLLTESIRGTDLFLMVDVCNHSLTYSVNGHLNPFPELKENHCCRQWKSAPCQCVNAFPL